jgi:hypothetical protein
MIRRMKIFGRNFSDRVTIEADRVWAEHLVREIGKHLPRMLRENPDRSAFWGWFCGEAESLFHHARDDEDRLYFQDLINKTLEDAGLEERFDLTRRTGPPSCEWHPAHARGRRVARPGAHRPGKAY